MSIGKQKELRVPCGQRATRLPRDQGTSFITYAYEYENESYWDKDKKQPRSRQKRHPCLPTLQPTEVTLKSLVMSICCIISVSLRKPIQKTSPNLRYCIRRTNSIISTIRGLTGMVSLIIQTIRISPSFLDSRLAHKLSFFFRRAIKGRSWQEVFS